MEILDNFLYILIEGEPNSPEREFINRVFEKLKYQGLLSNINYKVQEIGGSGNFNSIAKLIYQKSNLHQSIPVIGISDRDFRTQNMIEGERARQDNQFIINKSARIIYWERHEWENFLLEETELIANLLNQIPNQKLGEYKPYRKNTGHNLTKPQLDEWLRQYLESSIMKELLECLKFQFRENANFRITLDRVDFNFTTLEEIKNWFASQIATKSEESKNKILTLENMLENILLGEDFQWQIYIDNQEELDFQQAKIFFRGKEAIKYLCGKAIQELKIQDLDYEIFCKELLLPELGKNTNSLIVKELGLMLQPYFEQVANLTVIE